MTSTTSYRTCPLCEATCGLAITVEGRAVSLIRGDRDDVFSHGYICPKGSALKQLDADPDRLRAPMVRDTTGELRQATWEEALAEVDRRLSPIIAQSGRDAVALYLGNPTVHNLALSLYTVVLLKALGTTNVYSASTVDQMPKQVSAGLMFGTGISIPVPDVDRTDYLLMLGANPFASNGSLMTAPDIPGRLEALVARGGKLVVVDPRRTRTAEAATEHLFIRPGTDALFLMALVHTLFEEDLLSPGRLSEWLSGVQEVRTACGPFSPEAVASRCGILAGKIRVVARELAAAERAVVYGRIGTCTQEFGTTASWLVDVINALTGNLDRAGGAMFTKPAVGAAHTHGQPGVGRGVRVGRRHSRVRGAPEVFGEFPVACLAEEIETTGDGQIRALITVAGNPALSTPNGARLDHALESLDFMVCVDIYLNETTRHADVILPGLSPLESSHYDVSLYSLAIRNVANFSTPVFAPPTDRPAEWEILLHLAAVATGAGAAADVSALDDVLIAGRIEKLVGDPWANVHGRDAAGLLAALSSSGRRGPERLLDLMLRTGPYGDGFGADPAGLTLDVLLARPHGVDLGPLEPRLPDVLRTPSGRIELAPPALLADSHRLEQRLTEPGEDLVLIGRRDLRSNNSWMHNLDVLVKGKDRCTVVVHPDDAARLGLSAGGTAKVASRAGSIEVPVEVSDAIMPGVVSIPHGWGHDRADTRLSVARRRAGANSNLLTDEDAIDPVSGNAVLNGIPVTLAPG